MEEKIKGLKAVFDEQIKTPKHDEMCVYLLEPINIMEIINKISFLKNKLSKIKDDEEKHYYNQLNKEDLKEIKWDIRFKIILEYPVTSNGFLIGVIDANIKVMGRPLFIFNNNKHEQGGEIDLFEFFIEVKPSIISIGETLRQLNIYFNYLKARSGEYSIKYINKPSFVLFTCKKETKFVFESQDYSFISLEELEPNT